MPLEALSAEKHRSLRVRQHADESHLGALPYIPVVVSEFTHIGSECPIVFLKHSGTGIFQPVAMLSLGEKQNPFVRDGRWTGMYFPAAARQLPFKLIASEESPDNLFVGIDTDDSSVSAEDGEALFDADGRPTPYLEKRKEGLLEFARGSELTRAFVDTLVGHELLREKSLNIDSPAGKGGISGLYIVDEDRLRELPTEDFLALREKNFLGVIYAHMLSLNQLRRLTAALQAGV